MKEKLFYLGVGCQKGGTTWLHSQLSNSQFVDTGFNKEYHVFDALFVEEFSSFLSKKLERLHVLLEMGELMNTQSNLLRHLDFYRNPDNYFEYFDDLWRKSKNTVAVGDITPTYSALPADAFRVIKNGLEAKGFKVKVIYLMRDPVERCWSMLRMGRIKLQQKDPAMVLVEEQKALAELYTNRQCELRTRHELTLENLEKVFDSENIYYGFYETLFEKNTLEKLQEFLELSDFRPDITEQLNVSHKGELALNEALVRDVVHFYQETYRYCDSRFGIKSIWDGYNYL